MLKVKKNDGSNDIFFRSGGVYHIPYHKWDQILAKICPNSVPSEDKIYCDGIDIHYAYKSYRAKAIRYITYNTDIMLYFRQILPSFRLCLHAGYTSVNCSLTNWQLFRSRDHLIRLQKGLILLLTKNPRIWVVDMNIFLSDKQKNSIKNLFDIKASNGGCVIYTHPTSISCQREIFDFNEERV